MDAYVRKVFGMFMAIGLFAVCFFSVSSSFAQDVIKIGVPGPYSGAAA